jgi:hypothetical protein
MVNMVATLYVWRVARRCACVGWLGVTERSFQLVSDVVDATKHNDPMPYLSSCVMHEVRPSLLS